MSSRRVCCVLCLVLNLVTGVEPAPHPSLPKEPLPKSKRGKWADAHKRYVSTLKKRGRNFKVVFFGDSITEFWKGGSFHPAVGPDNAKVWKKHFEGLKADAFGIAGDLTTHLQWRLLNGELQASMNPDVVVLHIGTNDLQTCLVKAHGCSSDMAVDYVSAHIMKTANIIHARLPKARIVLLGLLPRANEKLPRGTVPSSDFYNYPSRYTPAVEGTNMKLRQSVADLDWVSYIDCSTMFLSEDKSQINRILMPDALHPSAAGYDLLAECLKPAIAAS